MKKMLISAVIVIVFVLLVGFIVSIPIVNNLSAKNVEKQLVEIALPDNTEMIESLSKAGKLVGNGNGMQYFGAILIRSDLTLNELSDYYLRKIPSAVVKEQKQQKIKCVEHEELSFKTPLSETENYFIVYLFGSGSSPFSDLDIRGH